MVTEVSLDFFEDRCDACKLSICEMNALVDNTERVVKDSVKSVMTSKLALSAILVLLAVALLRGFQLQTKILLRGTIILFIVNYIVLSLSHDYISSGRGYRDFLFKDPIAPPKNFEPVLLPDQNSSSQ